MIEGYAPVITSFNNIRNISAVFKEGNVKNFEIKLDRCGKDIMFLTCKACGLFHARRKRCNNRFCETCARSLSKRAKGGISEIVKKRCLWQRKSRHKLKFITLTCENFPVEKVLWGLEHLNKWFSNLVRRKVWKGKIKGFLKRIEVTRGQDGNYHLHIHVLAEGSFIEQADLSANWENILSRHGWKGVVVDIREVKGITKAIKEISKYCFKPNGLELEDKAFLSKVFNHRRLYSFGGVWIDCLKEFGIDDLGDDKGFACICGSRSFKYMFDYVDFERLENWKEYLGGYIFIPDTS